MPFVLVTVGLLIFSGLTWAGDADWNQRLTNALRLQREGKSTEAEGECRKLADADGPSATAQADFRRRFLFT